MISDLGSASEIAQQVDGFVTGDTDVRISSVAAIEDAKPGALTFAVDENHLRSALSSRAAAVLAAASIVDRAAAYPKPIIVVDSPRLALSRLLAALETPPPRGPFADPSASIDASATIGPDVHVGCGVVISANATIGARTVLVAGAFVGIGAVIGEDCLIDAKAYVGERSVLGDRVTLKPHAVIGSKGFGWAFLDGSLRKIPQVGSVELGDDVEIGANSCVDRAQTGVTSIGDGTKIDNLVQIGRNCKIGKHCAIAAQTGMAGSTIVGDYVQIGGQTGIKGHLTIGSRVRIAARAQVWGDIEDGLTVSGAPARAHRDALKERATLRRLPEILQRLLALERRVSDPGP